MAELHGDSAGARRSAPPELGVTCGRRRYAVVAIGIALLLGVAARPVGAAQAPSGAIEAEAALQAALVALNGVPASECADGGQTPPAGKDTCVSITSGQAAQAGAGLVAVQASLAAGVQPTFVLIGQGADGVWGLWFTAPAAYVPVQLPSEARVCAGGDGLNVRAEPSLSATILDVFADETVITVDGFYLAAPGRWLRNQGSTIGQGWYRVMAPLQGWVAAQYLVVADGGCELALP